MTNTQISPLREQDFEAIEAAVMETERGRWFLAEYARRHRAADTVVVVDAIGKLEKLLRRERRPDADRIRLDIGEMKDAIERTKAEIAEIKFEGATGSRFHQASDELDAIVTQTEHATSEILESAEKIQEIAWVMREAKVEEEICAALETLTTTIYTSCSFQDLTGQRTQKVVHVLRYLESRIDSMIEIWGMEPSETAAPVARPHPNHMDTRPDAHLLNGPALAGQGTEQADVDDLMAAAPAAFDDGTAADTMVFDRIEAEDEPLADDVAAFDEIAAFDDVSDTAADLAADELGADDLETNDLGAGAFDTAEAAAAADLLEVASTLEAPIDDAGAVDAADEASAGDIDAFAADTALDEPEEEPDTAFEPPAADPQPRPAALRAAAAHDEDDTDVLSRLSLDERYALFA
ncbi:protein phosphatase CheZ [Methylobrevis albus]|uniref:Protein phosphatase CheZ n=1 Tax=Methylobrevis albus TaxID=2793297 RepID=A0A931HYC9_9HYPH|nr:protein phosphatase CheZ [Methylobrevis albus]MBH0236822.1 protein phosphatase CheZ [Methylobrevis albus]